MAGLPAMVAMAMIGAENLLRMTYSLGLRWFAFFPKVRCGTEPPAGGRCLGMQGWGQGVSECERARHVRRAGTRTTFACCPAAERRFRLSGARASTASPNFQ